MLNAAQHVETVVVDDPDEPAIGRAPTEELVMHVYAIGVWHRRTPDTLTTACGVPLHHAYMPTRREDLAGHLCSDCFTPFERDRAELENEKRRNRGEMIR
jgi:hypothetical protein